jgi:hypothetical protein
MNNNEYYTIKPLPEGGYRAEFTSELVGFKNSDFNFHIEDRNMEMLTFRADRLVQTVVSGKDKVMRRVMAHGRHETQEKLFS